MSDEPEEIEVDIVDKPEEKKPADKPDAVEIVVESPPEKREILTLDEGVDKLKANLEAANRRAEDEARGRREAENKVAEASKQAQDGELREVGNAIEVTTRDLDAAKAAYRAARTAGDVEAELDATDKITEHRMTLTALNAGKSALEARAKQPQRSATPASADPIEALAASIEGAGNPRSAAWVRAHPQYAQSTRNYNKMLGAHYRAVGEGLTPETDTYFDFINKDLGHTGQQEQPQPVERKADPNPEQPMSNASRPVAPSPAPVSRQPAGGPSPGKVRLSRAEAEAAEFSFPDMPKAEAYRLYAKNKQAA